MGARFDRVTRKSARERWQDLPEDTPAELIGEEIVHWSPGNTGHANAASVLGSRLIEPFRFGKGGPGGWWILVEPEVELAPLILIPDLAGWRKERLVPESKAKPITVVPDWVCEILSPSTAARDRTVKLAAYGRCGVKHVWLVDPDVRTLEVLHREGDRWMVEAVHAGDERVRAEPFDAVELELAALWLPAQA